MKTAQDIFDQVSVHLMTQGERAEATALTKTFAGSSNCMYKTPAGLTCAIGCLIPDDEYDGGMEGLDLVALFRGFPVAMAVAGLEAEHLNLLRRLQSVHDCTEFSRWTEGLRSIAMDFNLNTHTLDVFLHRGAVKNDELHLT